MTALVTSCIFLTFSGTLVNVMVKFLPDGAEQTFLPSVLAASASRLRCPPLQEGRERELRSVSMEKIRVAIFTKLGQTRQQYYKERKFLSSAGTFWD